MNIPAEDSLVVGECIEPYWVGSFEDDITELGFRATHCSIEENEGFGINLLLKDMEHAFCKSTPS